MAHASTADQKLENPGTLKASGALTGLFGAFVAVGVIAFLTGYGADSTHAWTSLLRGHFFFMEVSIAALVFIAIQWITTAMWSAPVLRIAEGFTAYLPFVVISSILVLCGAHHIFPWTHPEHVHGDPILEGKTGYLNMTFFSIRTLFAVLGWNIFAWKITSGSLSVDSGTPYREVYERNRRLAVGFICFFAITFSLSAYDQLMSLDPHWFSTMFAVYIFAGAYQTFFATLAIVVILLRRAGYLKKLVNENHIHDIAKLMFAFTVFWAYTGFSQYMLYWYANLPEETGWFILRFNPHWEQWTIGLFIAKFFVPFFALLPRGNKRSEGVVIAVAFWIWITQYMDLNWIIQPQIFGDGPRYSFVDIGVWIGFLGVFGLMISRRYQQNNLVFVRDPFLKDSVFHHHI